MCIRDSLLDAHAGPARLAVGADELCGHGVFAHDDVVTVQYYERLVRREGLRLQDGVAEALCLFLAQKKDVRQVGNAKALLQPSLIHI